MRQSVGTHALEKSISEHETALANESERDKESDADADVDGEGEREKWLRRNPKMAAFIGDSTQGPIDSEDESESDGRRSNSVASENHRSRAGLEKQNAEEAEEMTPTAETRDLENVPPTSNGTSAVQVAAHNGANDSNDARDKEEPTSDPSVPTEVDSVDETSSTTTKDASDIPKGLRDSSQSKERTANQKPAGLSAAALKSVPRGLSRGNARNTSSTFHASKKVKKYYNCQSLQIIHEIRIIRSHDQCVLCRVRDLSVKEPRSELFKCVNLFKKRKIWQFLPLLYT